MVAHNPTDKPIDVTIQLDSKVLKSFRFSATLLPDNQPLKLKGSVLTLKLAELGTVVVALSSD
ncbi:MAG: hypothetical protein NZ805_13270 [Armatimonadetes bacterium]|nr:hypothetical protein [Armatimonadota bacterium]